MPINAVSGQAGGVSAASAAAVARAFPSNVVAGSLIAVIGFRYEPASDAYVAGDCTKSAGTATISTPILHVSENREQPGHGWAQVGIWTALVTAGGSLTMQVAGGTTGGYPGIATHEFTGSFDATRQEATASNWTATNNVNPAHSNDATSAGHALFLGGLALNTVSPQTITPEAAFTQIYENEAGNTSQAGSAIFRIVSGGTTDRAEWTVPTIDILGWLAAVVAIREAIPSIDPSAYSNPIFRLSRPIRRLQALWQNPATDIFVAPIEPETNPHLVGRHRAPRMVLAHALWQNPATDFTEPAPIFGPPLFEQHLAVPPARIGVAAAAPAPDRIGPPIGRADSTRIGGRTQ